jgi:hypothetical protein
MILVAHTQLISVAEVSHPGKDQQSLEQPHDDNDLVV